MMADFSLSLSEMLLPELKSRWRLDPKGTNFSFWRRELDAVFFDNKVKYVLERPIPDKESDPEAHQKFLDDDLTARHIILGTLHDSLFLSFHDHETAKSLLDALTLLFTKPSMAKRISLLKRYVGHKMGEGAAAMSANMHVVKMIGMAIDLEREGVGVPDELQAVVLMNSLPGSWYDDVTTMTLNMHGDEEKMKLKNVQDSVRRVGGWKEVLSRKC